MIYSIGAFRPEWKYKLLWSVPVRLVNAYVRICIKVSNYIRASSLQILPKHGGVDL